MSKLDIPVDVQQILRELHELKQKEYQCIQELYKLNPIYRGDVIEYDGRDYKCYSTEYDDNYLMRISIAPAEIEHPVSAHWVSVYDDKIKNIRKK